MMPGTHRRLHLPVLLLSLLTLALIPPAADAEFRVRKVETPLVDDSYYLKAQIDYGFSSAALEALDNGVPLTIEVHVQVRAADAWLWDESLLDQRLRYRIHYKPLSERYQVTQLPGAGGRSFVTRDAAIRALGEIHGLQLVGRQRLDPELDYEIHIKAALDTEELPLPLRPMAYLLPSWQLSSGWTSWPLRR